MGIVNSGKTGVHCKKEKGNTIKKAVNYDKVVYSFFDCIICLLARGNTYVQAYQ